MITLCLILKSSHDQYQLGKHDFDASNLNFFKPKRGVKTKIKKLLLEAGFDVFISDFTITVTGKEQKIKDFFKLDSLDSLNKNEIDIPSHMEKYIYKITFPENPTFF
jgi:hypothetical protein